MGWLTLTLTGLATWSLVTSFHLPHPELHPVQRRHIQVSNVLNFQRGSVESHPLQIKSVIKQQTELKPDESEYGSKSLPLRAAVEAIPDTNEILDAKWGALNIDRERQVIYFILLNSFIKKRTFIQI